MNKLILWVAISAASLLAASYISWLEGRFTDDTLGYVVPLIIGKAIGLVLIPAVLIGFVVIARKIFKRSTPNSATLMIGTIAWVVMAWSNIKVASFEATTENSSAGNDSMKSFEFSPNGCEFTVSFPGQPDKYTTQKAMADGELIPLHGAELIISNGVGLIRAECGSTNGEGMIIFNESNFVSYMTIIAGDLGLSRPDFKVESTPLGNKGTITGVRDTDRGRITVRVINLIGDSSILTLYLSAFSNSFQTPEMVPFIQSVEKRS